MLNRHDSIYPSEKQIPIYICLHIARNFCEEGKNVIYLNVSQDQEEIVKDMGLDKFMDEKTEHGIFINSKIIFNFSELENMLKEIIEDEDIGIDLIVVDDIKNLRTKSMMEKSCEDPDTGDQARAMSKLLLKYKPELAKKGITTILINQVRVNINMEGNSTVKESGGEALNSYPDYRVRINSYNKYRNKILYYQGSPYSVVSKIQCEKNKYTKPHITYPLYVAFGEGISNIHTYQDILMDEGVIEKMGGMYKVNDDNFESMSTTKPEEIITWIEKHKNEIEEHINSKGQVINIPQNSYFVSKEKQTSTGR